ncbi:ABC transporter permease [Nocardioides massiliensis]|uniref:NitT/TauT family transport system permease protein n=1 Tax=Nocardioides massiliensis TaxID=1325935 RepID=A0ABT9NN40_9ACTN|nr:ABC transporter permease [Nocardioides massiliensis]MDP9821830.1 NitT/TauT family transport system permease protein [Nocardioides massiliensis]
MSTTSTVLDEKVGSAAPDPSAPRPARPRRRRGRPNFRGAVFAVGLVLFLEVLTATVITSLYVPRPSEVAVALWSEIQRGDILSGVGATMGAYARGLGIAIVAGVLLGAALGASRTAWEFFRVVIEFLRPLPSVALIPFSILLLGVGTTTTVAMVVYASLWPILFNTYYGVKGVNQVSIDAARTFGLNRWQIFRRVQIPSAATSIVTGIRISSAIALILVITVEILTRNGGLGYYIVRMQVAIRTEDMYAGILVVGVLGYTIALIVAALERRMVFWSAARTEGN